MPDKKRILVIDDDKNVGLMLKVKMEKGGGYEVFCAPEGKTGLSMARELKPDLIVLDFNMPGADGGDVKNKLAADGMLKDIPVAFLTSLVQPEEARKGRTAGGRPMISKQMDIKEIIARLEAVLAG